MDNETTPILSTPDMGKTVNTSKGISSENIPRRPEHKSPEAMLSSMRQTMSRAVSPESCCRDSDE